MNLDRDSLQLLKLASKRESIDFEDACATVESSVHAPYAAENLEHLESANLISTVSKMMPEGYKKLSIRITPKGQAILEAHIGQTREKWITRALSIAAIVISAISIGWQILSSVMPQ